jgi:hypothetical protein
LGVDVVDGEEGEGSGRFRLFAGRGFANDFLLTEVTLAGEFA